MIFTVKNPFTANILTTFDTEKREVVHRYVDNRPSSAWGGATSKMSPMPWEEWMATLRSQGIDPLLSLDEGI